MKEVKDITQDDRAILLQAALALVPEGHVPAEAVISIASHPFDGDIECETAYTIITSQMAPHTVRGFIDTTHELLADIYDW